MPHSLESPFERSLYRVEGAKKSVLGPVGDVLKARMTRQFGKVVPEDEMSLESIDLSPEQRRLKERHERAARLFEETEQLAERVVKEESKVEIYVQLARIAPQVDRSPNRYIEKIFTIVTEAKEAKGGADLSYSTFAEDALFRLAELPSLSSHLYGMIEKLAHTLLREERCSAIMMQGYLRELQQGKEVSDQKIREMGGTSWSGPIVIRAKTALVEARIAALRGRDAKFHIQAAKEEIKLMDRRFDVRDHTVLRLVSVLDGMGNQNDAHEALQIIEEHKRRTYIRQILEDRNYSKELRKRCLEDLEDIATDIVYDEENTEGEEAYLRLRASIAPFEKELSEDPPLRYINEVYVDDYDESIPRLLTQDRFELCFMAGCICREHGLARWQDYIAEGKKHMEALRAPSERIKRVRLMTEYMKYGVTREEADLPAVIEEIGDFVEVGCINPVETANVAKAFAESLALCAPARLATYVPAIVRAYENALKLFAGGASIHEERMIELAKTTTQTAVKLYTADSPYVAAP